MKDHDENIKSLEEKIHNINSQIDMFQSKVESVSGQVGTKLSGVIDELKSKEANLLEKVDGLKKASDNSREDLEIGVKMSLDDLHTAYTSAKERFEKELS